MNFENLQISCKNDIWPVIERQRELQRIMKIGTKSKVSIIITYFLLVKDCNTYSQKNMSHLLPFVNLTLHGKNFQEKNNHIKKNLTKWLSCLKSEAPRSLYRSHGLQIAHKMFTWKIFELDNDEMRNLCKRQDKHEFCQVIKHLYLIVSYNQICWKEFHRLT